MDRLEPAGDIANPGKALRHSLDRRPEHPSDTDRREEVVEIVPAKQGRLKLARPPGSPEGHPDPAKIIRGSLRCHVCLRSKPVRHDRPARHFPQSLARRVIHVDDRGPALLPEHREQLSLRREVLLHGPVEVQVILGEVGEDGDVKSAPRNPMEGQRVRRDFHDGCICSLLTHPPKHRL